MSIASVRSLALLLLVAACAAPGGASPRADLVTLRGAPVTLVGDPLASVPVGARAPDVTLVGNDLGERRLSELRGKVVLLSTVPSLDTKVCDLETRTFDERAVDLGEDVVVVTVSMDLPFAQARWCGAAGVERVLTLSDARRRELGDRWGLRIEESGLLARAVFVLDRAGVVRHAEIVPELTREPDYDAALRAARTAAAGP